MSGREGRVVDRANPRAQIGARKRAAGAAVGSAACSASLCSPPQRHSPRHSPTHHQTPQGRPILGAIEGDGLDGVAVLVTRFFGGTKLGSGGLARAYGGAARDCLRAAPKVFVKRRVAVQAVAPFAALGQVYGAVARHGGEADGEERYTDVGDVAVTFLVDADCADSLVEAVSNATSGRVVPEVVVDGGEGEGEG